MGSREARASGMACQRFRSEDSKTSRQMDIISQLEGVPHVLEQIFLYLDIEECVKVSTTWKRLITSLNLWKCVWKNNMRMSSTWKALSVRMEHLRPQLSHRMRENSYQEACQYVKGNIHEISQSAMKDLHFQALADEDGNLNNEARLIRMNEKYVFIGVDSKVVIVNRWTRKLVKDLDCRFGYVRDMQLNERFIVVQLYDQTVGNYQIDVYDVQKLVHIQTLETNNTNHWKFGTKFALGSHAVFISGMSMQLDDLMFHIHRWNPSTARFVRDTQTEHKLQVTSVDYLFSYPCFYVDEKYLIVDFYITECEVRLFQVYSLATMQLVRERQFIDDGAIDYSIRHEYHDGAIVVPTCTADGQPCVALWDVDKDTVQPMADHPSQFSFSFAMTHHPFQIVIKKIENPQQLLLVQRGRPTRNSVIAMPSQCCVHLDLDSFRTHFYFDGLQMIAKSRDSSNARYGIVMADLVG